MTAGSCCKRAVSCVHPTTLACQDCFHLPILRIRARIIQHKFTYCHVLEDRRGVEMNSVNVNLCDALCNSALGSPTFVACPCRQPLTVSRLPLPTVEAVDSGPFCCFSLSSNFANSSIATSSSWSRTCSILLTSSI